MQQTIQNLDIGSWNAILLAFSIHGNWNRSFTYFKSMLQSIKVPDEITFTHILNAASHAGEVDMALEVLLALSSSSFSLYLSFSPSSYLSFPFFFPPSPL